MAVSSWQRLLLLAKDHSRGLSSVMVDSKDVYIVAREPSSGPPDAQMTFSSLSMPPSVSGLAVVHSRDAWEITPWALHQLGERLNIQEHYIMRCPPELQAQNLNYWLRTPPRRLMFRVRDGIIRAVLSPQYTPFGHYEMLAALSTLPIVSGSDVKYSYLDDELMRVMFAAPAASDDLVLPPGSELVLNLENSDVGMSRVGVSLAVWHEADGSSISGAEEHGLKRQHQGIKPQEFIQDIQDALALAVADAPVVARKLAGAVTSELTAEASLAIRDAVRDSRLPVRLRELVQEAYDALPSDQQGTRYSLSRAFAAAAVAMPARERLSVEKVAGSLMFSAEEDKS
jgi:hypothetical protein